MFRADHVGLREVLRDWENFGAKNSAHRRAMYRAAQAVRNQVRADIRSGVTIKSVTGRLARSLRIGMLTTMRGVEAEVWPKVGYGAVLEEGRVIRPRKPGGRLMFPLATAAGGGLIHGGVFRRTREKMERLAEKAGVEKTATYRHTRNAGTTYRGRVHMKGEKYFSSSDLKPFRTGVSANFSKLLGRGEASLAWVAPREVTIPAFGWLALGAEGSADAVAEILGDGFQAQLVRNRLAGVA